MGCVENNPITRLANPVEGAHVRHEIVIPEGRPALREKKPFIAEGGQLEDPAAYLKRVNALLMK
jgi:hypothetical protein